MIADSKLRRFRHPDGVSHFRVAAGVVKIAAPVEIRIVRLDSNGIGRRIDMHIRSVEPPAIHSASRLSFDASLNLDFLAIPDRDPDRSFVRLDLDRPVAMKCDGAVYVLIVRAKNYG